jgi:hypothetical protein
MSNNPFRNSLLRDYGRTSVSPHECQVPSNWPPQNLATAISSGASQTGVHIVLSGQEFVSTHFGTSQYDLGGPSACGLASLNAVRIVLDLEHSGVVGLNLLEEMAKQSLMEVRLFSSLICGPVPLALFNRKSPLSAPLRRVNSTSRSKTFSPSLYFLNFWSLLIQNSGRLER